MRTAASHRLPFILLSDSVCCVRWATVCAEEWHKALVPINGLEVEPLAPVVPICLRIKEHNQKQALEMKLKHIRL
jgi:hypothetical protein